MTELIPATRVAEIVGNRDAALARATEAADLQARGRLLASEAEVLARRAHEGATFHEVDHAKQAALRRLFVDIDQTASVEAFRKHLDACVWMRLIEMTGIHALMDRTAKEKLWADLSTSVPEVTEDAVFSIIGALVDDVELIFQRGLAVAFSTLDRRFKSHDAFKLDARMILTKIHDENGYWNYYNSAREQVADVERVFAVLDGKPPDVGALARTIEQSRQGGHGPRQGTCESPYFRIRTYMNGNAHLWFTRPDLVDKANRVLADYYGAVLPDAVPGEGPESDLGSSSREVSRDLAFYPTPDAVVEKLMRGLDVDRDSVVLEPSAGDGAIAKRLLATGARVTAIEVDPTRYDALCLLRGRLTAHLSNFLRWQQRPEYTHVVMNPPFYGVHWIDHVVHAYGFLRPGGELATVLPVSAELGETRRHVEFRAWAKERSDHKRLRFEDLPAESFAQSGTRVNTVLLRLCKPA